MVAIEQEVIKHGSRVCRNGAQYPQVLLAKRALARAARVAERRQMPVIALHGHHQIADFQPGDPKRRVFIRRRAGIDGFPALAVMKGCSEVTKGVPPLNP